jgi:shikimate kinase
MEFQREVMIGLPGAGKSSVSRNLARVESMERDE